MKTKYACVLGATLKMHCMLLTVLAVLFLTLPAAAEHDRPPRILVLHSYHQGLEWTDALQRGISRVIAETKAEVDLDIHYLDMARLGPVIGKDLVEADFVHHLKNVQHGLDYDLVLVSDNDALETILRHRETIAPGAPVVFCGVNNFSQSMISGHSGITGVAETPSFDKTFELAAALWPGLGKVLVLGEDTATGRQNLSILNMQMASASPRLELHFSTETDIAALEKRLAVLTPEWAVLPMCRPFEGARLLSVAEASARLSKASPVPLFAAWDFWMNHGPMGGVAVSSVSQGGAAASIALRILQGEPVDSIPVLEDSPNLVILDQNALDRFSIPAARVPREASILNHVPSFYEQHHNLVWTYGLLSLAGTVLCLLLALNVVARRKADASLKRQLLFTETLLRAIPSPIFYKDTFGRYLGCNKAFADFHGLSEIKVKGGTVHELFPGSQGALYEAKDRELLLSEGVQCYEHSLQTHRGPREVIICKSVFSDEHGHPAGIVGMITDITDRKAMELELLSVRDAALAASVVKSVFLANMSHEIRTPLNGLMGMLQLLKSSSLTDEQNEFIGMALVSGKRLTALLSDILDISRIEADKLTITKLPFDLGEMRASIETLFSFSAAEKGIEFDVQFDDNLPRTLVGDELRLRQILFNLVGNAIKFTTQGYARVQISMQPGKPEDECRILCCVSDSGPGISDDILAKVFDPFVQGEDSYVQGHQGAGLGLAIVARLVNLMGGTLSIDTSETGTTICLSLPLQISPTDAQEFKTCRTDDQTGPARLRILLAEDDPVNMFAATRTLEKAGHVVAAAPDGEQALKLLREADFDLILMDIQMPLMDGMQATALIRSDASLGDKSRIPIVAMTAYAMRGDAEKFLSGGMDGYIAKPLDSRDLFEVIRDVVSRRKACR
jgi:PAS domain S-box-containing protein